MTLRTSILLLCLASTSLHAEITSLHLISSPGDPVGKGKRYSYHPQDGKFDMGWSDNKATFKFKGKEWWTISFATGEGALGTGLYKNATQERLHLSGNFGNGWESIGNFHVLELQKEGEKITSFAANFFEISQHIKNPPLFGAVRYNSTVPLYAEIREICGLRNNPTSALFFTESQNDQSHIITDNDYSFKYKAYSQFEEGLIIEVKRRGKDEDLIKNIRIEIYTSDEGGLQNGTYVTGRLGALPHQPIRFVVDSEEYVEGKYKILHIERDKKGKVKELALNFLLPEWNEIQGALRYNSSLPVNFAKPFDE